MTPEELIELMRQTMVTKSSKGEGFLAATRHHVESMPMTPEKVGRLLDWDYTVLQSALKLVERQQAEAAVRSRFDETELRECDRVLRQALVLFIERT